MRILRKPFTVNKKNCSKPEVEIVIQIFGTTVFCLFVRRVKHLNGSFDIMQHSM